jgi:hypothetical protein
MRADAVDPIVWAARGGTHPADADDAEKEPAEGQQPVDPLRFSPGSVVSAAAMVERGRRLMAEGVPYLIHGLVPDLGMVGFLVAYAKSGKSTLGMTMTKAITDKGTDTFMDRSVQKRRGLYVALEDPEDYTAWLMARAFDGTEDCLIYPRPLLLNDLTLGELEHFIVEKEVGFVYVASFLASIRGRVKDENDNASMSAAVASLKLFARRIGKPLLMEAHAGKGENMNADADPVKALRGASAAGAEADYLLSLKREGKGGFTTRRTLSGLGRFVSVAPIAFDYDQASGRLTLMGDSGTSAATETDWRLIQEGGALTAEWRSAEAIARAAGLTSAKGLVERAHRDRVTAALYAREGVQKQDNGKTGGGRRVSFRLITCEG